MNRSNNQRFTVKDARQTFNKILDHADKNEDTVIYHGDQPAYLLLSLEKLGPAFFKEFNQLKVKWHSESLMDEYDGAYKSLA